MKSTTIKTIYETDVLFTGEVPGMGHTILVCACINAVRVYARITGNIINVYANNGSVFKTPGKLCSGSNFSIVFSSKLDDIDAEVFGEIEPTLLELATKAFEVR